MRSVWELQILLGGSDRADDGLILDGVQLPFIKYGFYVFPLHDIEVLNIKLHTPPP